MPSREDLVAEVRRWRDTPHKWQQSACGRGCDCLGLIVGTGIKIGMPEAPMLANIRRNYGHAFDPNELLVGLKAILRRVRVAEPGDVLVIRIGDPPRPRHLAMLTQPGYLIHSYGGGLGKVVEVPVGKSRPIHSIWTWPSFGPSLAGA